MNKNIQSIKCEFELLSNFPEEGKRYGRYSQSQHPEVKGFGKDKWVILAYINVDWEQEKKKGLLEQDIFAGCLSYFNEQKNNKGKPKYGFLEVLRADFKFKENRNPKLFIIAQIITDQRRNEYFWCEGPSMFGEGKKRGRPRKVIVSDPDFRME